MVTVPDIFLSDTFLSRPVRRLREKTRRCAMARRARKKVGIVGGRRQAAVSMDISYDTGEFTVGAIRRWRAKLERRRDGNPPKPRRRWFQFSLRTLFYLTAQVGRMAVVVFLSFGYFGR